MRKSSELNKDTFRGHESQDQGTSQGYGDPPGIANDQTNVQNDSLQISRTTNLVNNEVPSFKPLKRKHSIIDENAITELKIKTDPRPKNLNNMAAAEEDFQVGPG